MNAEYFFKINSCPICSSKFLVYIDNDEKEYCCVKHFSRFEFNSHKSFRLTNRDAKWFKYYHYSDNTIIVKTNSKLNNDLALKLFYKAETVVELFESISKFNILL